MKTRLVTGAVSLAMMVGSSAVHGVDRMVGVVPSDGVVELLKEFDVTAGTVITGATFANNDATTVFPQVSLLHAEEGDLSLVAWVTNAQETSSGTVAVTWSSPVSVQESGTYYVAVRFPAGPSKQGPGVGPAIGANDIEDPQGCFLASGTGTALIPVLTDLAITLTQAASKGFHGAEPEWRHETPDAIGRAFLQVSHSSVRGAATVRFDLPTSGDVNLEIYDVMGRRVRSLFGGQLSGGTHAYKWNGRDARGRSVANGVYFVVLRGASQTDLRGKFVLAH